jgi:hypothetical protein
MCATLHMHCRSVRSYEGFGGTRHEMTSGVEVNGDTVEVVSGADVRGR